MKNTGQIIRSKSTNRFTVIPNEILKRSDLSLKAKGLIAYLLSLPDDWVLHQTELSKNFTDGDSSIRTAFNELKENGYILSVDVRNDKGHFVGKNYIIYDEPHLENPILENPICENPISDNRKLQNTNNTKDELIQNNDKYIRFDFKKELLGLGVDKKIADEYMIVRKKLKAINTETAYNRLKTEIKKSGLSANECIKILVENSWKGFKAEWVKNRNNGKQIRTGINRDSSFSNEFDTSRFKVIGK